MIKELHLHNWKSFEESVLYIDPLTMLIGTNASGKSNVVDALVFLNRVVTGRMIHESVASDKEFNGIRGGSEWLILKGKSYTKISIVLDYNFLNNIIEGLNVPSDNLTYSLELSRNSNGQIEVYSESLYVGTTRMFSSNNVTDNEPSIRALFYNGKQGKGKAYDFRRTQSILFQARSLPNLTEVVDSIEFAIKYLSAIKLLDPIPSLMRQFVVPFNERLLPDASNFAGVLAFHGLDLVKPVILDYLKEFPENEIQDITIELVGPNKKDAMLLCSEKWAEGDSLTVDSRVLSDGTLRFLGIMTAVLTSDPNSLLVIEEIDNGFHPSRARLLIDFLKKYGSERNIDILCTTHNPAFLDSLGIEMLPFISVVYRDAKSGNSKISLLEDVKTLPKMLAKGSIGDMTTQGLLTDYFENEYVGT